jgi:ribosomal protein S6--L-glutamate ligase
MRIGIIGRKSGWHANDLMRAARDTGTELVFIDLRAVAGGVAWHPDQLANAIDSKVQLLPWGSYDRILVRNLPAGSLEQVVFRMDVLHQCLAAGTPVINPPRALETCVDKFLTTARLEGAGLPVPATIVCQGAEDALQAFETLGRDVVLKPIFGSEGRGLVRITDRESAWRVFHALEKVGSVIYVQEFIRHPGWDLRAFVIGGHVIGSMRRLGAKDWRTNISQGGRAEWTELSEDDRDLAIRAARAAGALIAGVDILPGPADARFVTEVNSCPGWRGLSSATGTDIAGHLIHYVRGVPELVG